MEQKMALGTGGIRQGRIATAALVKDLSNEKVFHDWMILVWLVVSNMAFICHNIWGNPSQ
jgi:hypothetical protein